MPCCAAVNCSNRGEKGYRLFLFPRDVVRRAQWLQNTRRGNWTPTNTSRLCEVHFEDSQFENQRADGLRKLKQNAIPTLFELPNPPPLVAPRKSLYKNPATNPTSSNVVEASKPRVVESAIRELEVNAVDQLAVKKEYEEELAAFKTKDEKEDCEVKPFETIFIKEEEEDIGFPDSNDSGTLAIEEEYGIENAVGFEIKEEKEDSEIKPFETIFLKEEDIGFPDSNDSGTLAIEGEDGIENAVGFQIKEEDAVLAENGDAVTQVHKGNAYPSCSKNGGHSKSREESMFCGSSKQNKHHNLSSYLTAEPENHLVGKCQRRSIDKSILKKATTRVKPFQCSHCEFRCAVKRGLKSHMLTHTADKQFKCSYCNYRCAWKHNLKTHIHGAHTAQIHAAVKPIQCSHCEYRCSVEENLKSHMLTHTADKPFRCSNCEYRCSRKQSLKRHMLTHTGDKPFQCSSCEYRCSNKGRFNCHMLTHTGDKPFQCSHCDFRCSVKGTLKRHMLTHSGVKPFKCSSCDYRCAQKGNLKTHILTHTHDKPFRCSYCEYRCSKKQNLKRHMLTHTDC